MTPCDAIEQVWTSQIDTFAQEHPAHPGHLHAMRDLDMQVGSVRLSPPHPHSTRLGMTHFVFIRLSSCDSIVEKTDGCWMACQGHHSRLRDAETQEQGVE